MEGHCKIAESNWEGK